MHSIEILIILLVFIVGLSIIAKRINIVFPVLLTIAGLAIGFIPGLPQIVLEPSIVLLVFLPPILYGAAWYTNWKEFKFNFEPILMLSLGLVIFTSLGIAWFAQWLLPGFTLAMGFLLGAVISPPDAVAATSVLKKLKVPKKIVTVLEGESLVNDASALIIYQFALAAVITNEFSFTYAAGKFLLVVAGGIVTGFAVGFISYRVHKAFTIEPAIETLFTFITAYGAYLLAEKLHVNGLLSVVTAGMYMGRKQSSIHSPVMRIQAVAVWDFITVFLNGIIFILIGLQLPYLVANVKGTALSTLIRYGILISVAATVLRFVYIFFIDRLSFFIRGKMGLKPVFPTLAHTFILAFTSMRGVVSLAAAFSIPVMIDDGKLFPQRELILFLTFSVVLFTLLFQGLLLPVILKFIHFGNSKQHFKHPAEVRKQLSGAALHKVNSMIESEAINSSIAEQIKSWHEKKLSLHEDEPDSEAGKENELGLQLRKASIAARREKLHELRDTGLLDPELFHKIEGELDLEEVALYRQH
jgi:monovalent cation/hydrogen antiporter